MKKKDRIMMNEMKKVWNVGYSNSYRDKKVDKITEFVFRITDFDTLMETLLVEFPEWNHNRDFYVSYAITRWYKYRSAMFAESVFTSLDGVIKATPEQDRQHIDFFVEGVPFDLKNVMFPKTYGRTVNYAKRNPKDLLVWLVENQGGRFWENYNNQLFLIFNSSYRPNWMMKAEFPMIERAIERWMKHHHLNRLDITVKGHKLKADLLWVTE